jgi:hypothetical protein
MEIGPLFKVKLPLMAEGFSAVWVLSATISQKAYLIKGAATANHVEAEKSIDVINYEISGHICDRFVSITFRNKDKTRIAYSIFLLEVRGDGTHMTGYRAFYGLRKETIRAVECTWRRGIQEVRCRSHNNTEAA